MLQLLLLWHMSVVAVIIVVHGCCGCHCHSVWVLQPLSLWRMGVAAVVVAAQGCCGCHHHTTWVLQLLSSHCVGCHRCCCHSVWFLSSPCIITVIAVDSGAYWALEGEGGHICWQGESDLAAKEKLAKKKNKREERNHTSSIAEGEH